MNPTGLRPFIEPALRTGTSGASAARVSMLSPAHATGPACGLRSLPSTTKPKTGEFSKGGLRRSSDNRAKPEPEPRRRGRPARRPKPAKTARQRPNRPEFCGRCIKSQGQSSRSYPPRRVLGDPAAWITALPLPIKRPRQSRMTSIDDQTASAATFRLACGQKSRSKPQKGVFREGISATNRRQ